MNIDWKTLFLSMDGRISRGPFWIGLLIIMVLSMLLGLLGVIGAVLSLPLIWAQIAVYGKRLHDMGRSMWLIAISWGVIIVSAGLVAFSFSFSNTIGAILGSIFALVCLLASIGFVFWVGLTRGQPADNRFGPPPVLVPAPSKDL